LKAAAVAAMLVVAAPAMAQDDDQDCDNIMDELKKLAERLMNTNDPKGVGPVCAATGQLLGIIKASREVAAECYEEGRKRSQLLQTFDKAAKVDPGYPPLYLYRGQVLYEVKQDYPGAIQAWQRFLALVPSGEEHDRVAALLKEAQGKQRPRQ